MKLMRIMVTACMFVVSIFLIGQEAAFLNSLKEHKEQHVVKKTQQSGSVNSFLASLSDKKKSDKKDASMKKTTDSTDINNFLSSLSKNQNLSEETIAKEKQEQEQRQQQALQFMQQYYGNPDYKAAMKILNDADLQAKYQEGLEQIGLFFLEYTQKILSTYNASEKGKVKNTSISNFISSLNKKGSNSPKKSHKKSSSEDTFLSSLKQGDFSSESVKNKKIQSGSSVQNGFLNSLNKGKQSGSKSSVKSKKIKPESNKKPDFDSNSVESFLDSLKGK